MTKEKLARLISLSVDYWVERYRQEGVVQFDARKELAALQAEFEGWEPEREVNRWKQEFKSYAVNDDARCEYFKKCQCGLDELLKEAGG